MSDAVKLESREIERLLSKGEGFTEHGQEATGVGAAVHVLRRLQAKGIAGTSRALRRRLFLL
jgi:hypothetical protein